ncbi:hypothetical protein [Natronospora cellulosivora (SeqCode)]
MFKYEKDLSSFNIFVFSFYAGLTVMAFENIDELDIQAVMQ